MAQSNRKTTPPQFKESVSYKVWKNKIQMWQLFTSVPKKEQTTIVRLELLDNNVKAEKAVAQLTATESNVDNGMEILLNKLDSFFQSEKLIIFTPCSLTFLVQKMLI